jgi:hypothetical protein
MHPLSIGNNFEQVVKRALSGVSNGFGSGLAEWLLWQ